MRHAWLGGLVLAMMPAVASAGHHDSFRFGFGFGVNTGFFAPGFYGGYCGPRYYTSVYYPPAVVYRPVVVETAPPPVVVYQQPAVVVAPPVVYAAPTVSYYVGYPGYRGRYLYRDTHFYYGR